MPEVPGGDQSLRARIYWSYANLAMAHAAVTHLPHACSYCGSDERLTVDHLMPRSRGGPETADNVVWACSSLS